MRVQGWPSRLNEHLKAWEDRYKARGFAWGENDCVHFAADWVLACTESDPLEDYRGQYADEESAFALLRERDGTLYRALRKRFGNPVHPMKAQRGDIAYRKAEKALGIFFTSGAKMHALFLSDGGFTVHPAKECSHAFRVR